MNFTAGFPVAAMTSALTWYGQKLVDPLVPFGRRFAHGQPHVGVEEVGTGDGRRSRRRSRQPGAGLARPGPSAICRTSADGQSAAGAQIRTSMPSSAPVTSSEFAVLFRPSPR